jgi:hypothetical protein
MINPGLPTPDQVISFINRDHIVSVEIRSASRLVIFTTDGREINVPGCDGKTLDKFADELANTIQSNFVSIAHRDRSARFVDEGSDFITIVS